MSLSDNDINDITPLLNITAFEENASINLIDNPLAHTQSCAVITALRARGVEVQENAAQCRHTLTYVAGPNGSIAGTSPQIVYIGENGSAVEAVPDWGYYFLAWSDDETENPRTDTNVTEDITVTAIFAPYQYTLSYLAGDHGDIDGPTPQLVDHGEDGLPVTAVPDYGYHFTDWDDGCIDNPRIDTANTEPLTVYASFDINQYYLNYLAGPNGTIFGNSEQLVNHGDCGTAVEALPDTGYHFSHWSDGLANALRTDCGNTEPLTVTASFQGNLYTVSFDAQGGSTPSPTSKSVIFGDIYGTLPTTTLPGHFFDGWWTALESGVLVSSPTRMLTPENHTLYARWTPQTASIFFHGMGASAVDPPYTRVTYGQPYGTLATASRPGYIFDGWWTAAVGGTQITEETTVTDTRINFYLYAHWTQITSTLTYLAGDHGSIEGEDEQTVPLNACGTAVTAVPDTGYHFVLWSDLLPDNSRMDCYNTEPLTVTADFAINQYTLAYAPGDYGTLSGNGNQLVNHGANGTAVQAIPDAGRTFVMWSDGVTANPRTDTDVTSDINVTAIISDPAQYTLNYVAGQYGTLTGSAIQYVNYGGDGSPVTAVPDTGCYFIKWSDERTDNPRTDMDVTGPVSVTAVFAINQYTLIYSAGTNGSIWGASSQTVNYDGNGTYIAALPDEGYHFSGWSDAWVNPGGGLPNAFRKDVNVTADINVTASFAPNAYTLSYAAGENGSLLGPATQSVYYGQDGAAVQAVPDTGYYFVSWSDGNTDNPRVDTNVQGSLTVTATFASIFGENFNLPDYLQVWMDFMRDADAANPLDTLAWFRDDPEAMYAYVLTLNWITGDSHRYY